MNLQPRHILLPGLLLALTVGGAGCSGVNHTHSVSPLDFMLPGAGHFLKVEPPKPAADPAAPATAGAPEVASAR